MRLNFKKISAIGASILLTGMTLGVAAAANYPAPFVAGGNADVAIVYGTGAGVSSLDVVQAGNIQSDLSTQLGSGTGSSDVTTSGETVALDTSSDKLWFNTSLNAIKSTLTKSDLPTVLEDYTFSGDVTSKITSNIKLVAGATAGGENSGKVAFLKQPQSSDDPQVGITLGTSQTSNMLYNASATMSAINFTNADSEGEEIQLFGQTFTVASETDSTKLVLLKEAERISLSSDNPSSTVTVDGSEYTVELVSASDTTATINIIDSSGSSQSKEIDQAASKRVNGIDVAVISADENNLKYSASILVGSQKVTLTNGAIVTLGEDDDPVDGTYTYLVGGTTATTEIAIAVFRPDSTSDAILPGEAFVDPVFGSFKVDFAGLSSGLDDSSRETISILSSGEDTMTVTMTDDSGNTKVIEFAHNDSNLNPFQLGDSSNYTMAVREAANLSYGSNKAKYVVVGNDDYGHLLELYDVYNQTTGTSHITNDRVRFRDVITGDSYDTTFTTSQGIGTVDVDGKRYTVTFNGTGEGAGVILKYPTSDSGDAQTFVMYPTIKTANGGKLAFYDDLTLTLADMDGLGNDANDLLFPDGDGYATTTVVAYTGGNATQGNWTFGGNTITTGTAYAHNVDHQTLTIGTIQYNVSKSSTTVNSTTVELLNPEDKATEITVPSIIFFEGKDDDSAYHAVVTYLEAADGKIGVSDVLFSATEKYHASATRASDSKITEDIDWYGTHVVTDATDSDQKSVTMTHPEGQVYSQIYMGETGSTVSGGSTGSSTALGNVLVTDSEVSSVGSKNLIVVGGSCINSAAATLVGGAYCGSGFTDAVGIGSGEYAIKGYSSNALTSKLALLVAGYDAADTVNGATYLTTKTVDTSKEYKGTTATSAEMVTSTA